MDSRGDDPLHDSPDDDRTRRAESTEPGADRDRPERSAEQGEERDAAEPDPEDGERDRAGEQAAAADAALHERIKAGAHRAGEIAAGSAAALLVSLTSMLPNDTRLPAAVTEASDAVEGVARDIGKKRQYDQKAKEPNQDPDRHEQPPPDREGDRPAVDRAADPADGVDVGPTRRGGADASRPDNADDD